MRRVVLAAVGLGCTALFSAYAAEGILAPVEDGTAVRAQDSQISSPPSGDYRALDFWMKLKIGTAYFTSPQFVRRTGFAYSFDWADFEAPDKEAALWELVKSGKVGFGIPTKDGDTVKILPSKDILKQYGIQAPAGVRFTLEKQGFSVFNSSDVLLGSKATDAFVKSGGGGGNGG
jgi:hypothetical protein